MITVKDERFKVKVKREKVITWFFAH